MTGAESSVESPLTEREMRDARLFVDDWLFKSRDRQSAGQPWTSQQIIDARRMCIAFHRQQVAK